MSSSPNFSHENVSLIDFPVYTFANEIEDGAIFLRPLDKPYLECNEIALCPSNVVYAESRVDVAENGRFCFLVEHMSAFCTLNGIQSCSSTGLNTTFDENRKSHVDAAKVNHKPQHVLGRADGRIWGNTSANISRRLNGNYRRYYRLNREISYRDAFGSEVLLRPAADVTKLDIQCKADGFIAACEASVQDGINESDLKWKVFLSRSIAVVRRWDSETLHHAMGDVIGDIIGIGGILAHISIRLDMNYHAATIGAVRTVMG